MNHGEGTNVLPDLEVFRIGGIGWRVDVLGHDEDVDDDGVLVDLVLTCSFITIMFTLLLYICH